MTFLYDIVNLEFIVIVSIVVASAYLRLEPLKVLLLFMHIMVIFLLNDVLFSPGYFGDQYGYVYNIKAIRKSIFTFTFPVGFDALGVSSSIFSMIPVPFINSIQSICMINFMLFLLLFVFTKKKFFNNNAADYFLLLFPSLLLYSSLALRDTLILVIMFISVYYIIIKEKEVLGLIIGFPLLYIKFQNYFMIILVVLLYKILKRRSMKINIGLFLAIIIGILIPEKIPIIGSLYNKIEMYRLALLAENMIKVTGKFYDWDFARSMFEPLGTGVSLIYLVAKNFLYMLFKPLPWECQNSFQIIQSVENIAVFIIIIMLNSKKIISHEVRNKVLFLNIMLFVSMAINGLVVFNFGTAVRYKFTFVVIYIAFYLLLLRYDSLSFNKNFQNSRLSSNIISDRS